MQHQILQRRDFDNEKTNNNNNNPPMDVNSAFAFKGSKSLQLLLPMAQLTSQPIFVETLSRTGCLVVQPKSWNWAHGCTYRRPRHDKRLHMLVREGVTLVLLPHTYVSM
jgi:hypothetical protein